MGVFDRSIEQARRQIKAKGQLVTWRVETNTAPADANQPWKPGIDDATPVTYLVSIAFIPAKGGGLADLARMLGAKEVVTSDVTGLMAADARFRPTEKDVVVRTNPLTGTPQELRINTLDVLAPNGEPILYTIGFAA